MNGRNDAHLTAYWMNMKYIQHLYIHMYVCKFDNN